MLYTGEVINDTYHIISEIGSGGMGVVYLAYHLRLQKNIVMKKIKSRKLDLSMLRNEVDILKELHHPYLPQVYDFIEYKSDIYTIIDYIDGYDLDYYIKNNYTFSESQLIKWLKQLCEVLSYLHKHNPPVIHTDIKPANIIITADGDICLIDFGISLSADDAIKGFSQNFSSPEQYINVINYMNGEGTYNLSIDARTDIYSLGATFYYIMTGYIPDVRNEGLPPLSNYQHYYSNALAAIIDKSMARNKNKRYQSADKMYEALENIKKQDKRYKKYVASQVVSSIIAGIFICFGILMVFWGNSETSKSDFNIKYNEFVDYCDAGNVSMAIDAGNVLLNNSKYNSVMNENIKADVFHSVGDCFFIGEDYGNAAYYYMSAVECCDSSKSELFYRDYAIALIKNNQINEAQQVLNGASALHPDSPSINLIKAEFAYASDKFDESLMYIQKCLSGQIDNENLYTSLVLSGDIYLKKADFAKAKENYEDARAIKENIDILRRLGRACLSIAVNTYYIDVKNISEAKECFTKISEEYYASVEDEINLSQTYRLSGEQEKAKQLLEGLLNSSDDYRIYMQLAFVCDDLNAPQTAIYCQKARDLYKSASDKDKQLISRNEFEQLMAVYKKHCNNIW